MARKFINPQGTYTEEVGIGTNIACLFFGPLALAAYGLWQHFAIWVVVILATAFSGPVGAFIAWLFLTFVYVFMVSDFRIEKLLRDGWRDASSVEMPDAENTVSGLAPEAEAPRTKICPYCAEEIKFEAIKCKHCGSDLTDKQ